eukprot:4005838-Pleurochrysis_carterae.AAC.2
MAGVTPPRTARWQAAERGISTSTALRSFPVRSRPSSSERPSSDRRIRVYYLFLHEDGTGLAIIPRPLSFRRRYTLPLFLADLVMTVIFDVAALPRYGLFRFDEHAVEYSDGSN